MYALFGGHHSRLYYYKRTSGCFHRAIPDFFLISRKNMEGARAQEKGISRAARASLPSQLPPDCADCGYADRGGHGRGHRQQGGEHMAGLLECDIFFQIFSFCR
jgi:hypothetical protein